MAAPLQEASLVTADVSELLELRGSLNIATARLVVTDCAAYGWRNADEDSLCLRELPPDFVEDNIAALNAAAISLLEPVLTKAWADKGYDVRFVEIAEGDPFHRDQPMETHWEVWDKAASELDVDQVVKTAGLVDVLATYLPAVANPDSLKQMREWKTLRDVITAHLDEWADSTDSPAVEQRIEGYRAALDRPITTKALTVIATELGVTP